MDPKNDIRKQYDPCGHEAAWVLQMQQPENTPATFVGWNTNGLDCLVAVIRRIYALMPAAFINDEVSTAAEEKNPILRYAWQTFDLPKEATDETLAQQAAEKKAIISKLFPRATDDLISFYSLYSSVLMRDSFWSRPEFHLVHPPLRKLEGDTTWRPIPWTSREMVNQSLISLDCNENPGMSLQQAVDLKFGVREWEQQETLFVCKRPHVVRVLFFNVTDQPSRSFEEMRTFDMPLTRVEGTGLVPDGRSRYALIAIARLRCPGFEAMDFVRLYGTHGENKSIAAHNPAFSAIGWSVGSPSPHTYVMVFARADDVQLEAYPEVCPRGAETRNTLGGDIEEITHEVLLSYRGA